jgi:hypothetical protein
MIGLLYDRPEAESNTIMTAIASDAQNWLAREMLRYATCRFLWRRMSRRRIRPSWLYTKPGGFNPRVALVAPDLTLPVREIPMARIRSHRSPLVERVRHWAPRFLQSQNPDA